MGERKKPRAPEQERPRRAPVAPTLSAEERAALLQMIEEVRAERLRLRQVLARG